MIKFKKSIISIYVNFILESRARQHNESVTPVIKYKIEERK